MVTFNKIYNSVGLLRKMISIRNNIYEIKLKTNLLAFFMWHIMGDSISINLTSVSVISEINTFSFACKLCNIYKRYL